MQQDSVVILQDKRLAVIRKGDASAEYYELSPDSVRALGKGYLLVLPDRFVNLVYTNLVPLKTKKLKEMVRAYMKTLYPDDVVDDADFGYLKTSPVIAYLVTEETKSLTKDYPALIENAGITTTPSLLALQAIRGRFLLKTGDTMLIKNDEDFIHVIGKLDGLDTSGLDQQIELSDDDYRILMDFIASVPDRDALNRVGLDLLWTKKPPLKIEALKTEIILFSVLYILFLVSLFFNLMPLKKEQKTYMEQIKGIYKKLDIENTSDPYGMLIFKVERFRKEHLQYPDPLKILSSVSLAFDQNAEVESITANKELIRIKGRIRTLEALEESTKRLDSELGIRFTTESAKVRGGVVNFVIVGRSR